MKYFYIFQDQLAGQTYDPENVPSGFLVVEGPDVEQDRLFYDKESGKVLPRPDKPSDTAVWSVDHWTEPEVWTIPPAPAADPDVFESVRRLLWGSILSIKDRKVQFAIALLAQMTLAGYAEQTGRQDLLDESMKQIQELIDQNGQSK